MIVLRCWLFLLLTCLACVPGAVAQPDLPAEQEARSLTFSPDGKLLALAVGGPGEFGFTTRRLEIWDVATGQRRYSLKCEPHEFTFFAFSPDGSKLLTCGVRSVQLREHLTNLVAWDIRTGQQVYELKVGSQEIVLVPVFSPDGALIAASAFKINFDIDFQPKNEPPTSRLKVWDAQTGGLKHDLAELGGEPSLVWFTPNGKYLIVAMEKRLADTTVTSKLLFLERGSFRSTRTMSVESTKPVGFVLAPDGQSFAYFYTIQSGEEPEEQPDEERSAEYHLNLMALQGDRAPLPLQMETRQVNLSAFRFSPDGAHFSAVVSFYGQPRPTELWRWDTKTGELLSALSLGEFSMTQTEFAAITPDTQTLAIARGTTVELRRTNDGEILRTFDVSR